MSGSKKQIRSLSRAHLRTPAAAGLLRGLAVVVSASVLLVVLASACTKSGPSGGALPSTLVPAAHQEAQGEAARLLRVRLYAGADYRARLLDWRGESERLLASASAILQRACGTGLELVETVEWKRSGGQIDKTLAALLARDPGRDVDLIIGLTDAPEGLETRYEQLAAFELLSRHLLVRSFNRQAESEGLGPEAAELSESSRDKLLRARRRHKQAAILANALARLFGAGEGQLGEINASTYDTKHTEIGAEAAALIGSSIRAHLSDRDGDWRALERTIGDRSALREAIARRRGALGKKAEVSEVISQLREDDRSKLESARRLLDSHKGEEAWAILERLEELYPKAAELALPSCLAAQSRSAEDAELRCRHATELDAKNPESWLALALIQLESDPESARASLEEVASRIDEDNKSWAALARAYQKLDLPRPAARAADRAGPTSVKAWALQSQLRYGTSVGISEAEEGEYLRELKGGLKLVYASNLPKAKLAARSLHTRYPKSIASNLVECEIAVRRRAYAEARTQCREVLSRHAENSWARYLLGIVEGREGKREQAIELLLEAIARDPDLKAAYQSAAKLMQPAKDARLSTLKSDYQARFKQELK